MRSFVAGATGYTGQAVVAELCEAGDEVLAHVRPGSRSADELLGAFEAQGARIDRTPWEIEPMRQTLRELAPEAVFCLIGTTRARMKARERRGEDPEEASYEAVDYGLTKLLVEACAGLDPAPRFVYLSSMGVGPNGLNAYMKARWRAEQAVQTSGVPYTIARPGMITGPDRDESRPMERLGGVASDALAGALDLVGASRLARRYGATDAAELAGALVRLARDPEAEDTIVEAEGLKGS